MECIEEITEKIPSGWERMILPLCPGCREKMVAGDEPGTFVHPEHVGPAKMSPEFWRRIENENDGR